MFVDSAPRLQHPCGAREKSASAILGVVKRFVTDIRVSRAFRTDYGAEYTNSTLVYYCNGLRTHREFTVPYKRQQNSHVESGLSRAIKAGHAERLEVNRLFPDIHLNRLTGMRDPDSSSLWMEYDLWVSEGFNRSATVVNIGVLSPQEISYEFRPPMPVLPFCKPAYHRILRWRKIDPQARPCYFLNFGYNHGSDCFKIMDAGTGRIVHSLDVVWHVLRKPHISPTPTVGPGVSNPSSCVEMPDYVYIEPPLVATATPTAAPAPDPATAAPVPASAPPLVTAPAPAPLLNRQHQSPIALFGN